jgi:uncharacterized protein YqgC (DUF456 family)
VLTSCLIIIGLLLQIVGLVGCVLPWLAGPPFNFLGLILLSLAKGWDTFSPTFLIVMGALTVLTMVLDYVLPMAGAKKYGSTRRGFWGAFGMVIGIILLPSAIIGFSGGGWGFRREKSAEAMKAGWECSA